MAGELDDQGFRNAFSMPRKSSLESAAFEILEAATEGIAAAEQCREEVGEITTTAAETATARVGLPAIVGLFPRIRAGKADERLAQLTQSSLPVLRAEWVRTIEYAPAIGSEAR